MRGGGSPIAAPVVVRRLMSTIVATIPAWLDMVVNMDELDINPPGGPKFRPQEWKTRRDLLEQFDCRRECLDGCALAGE